MAAADVVNIAAAATAVDATGFGLSCFCAAVAAAVETADSSANQPEGLSRCGSPAFFLASGYFPEAVLLELFFPGLAPSPFP